MDDLLALALALNKLGEGGLDMQRRSRTSKRSDAPQRDPTDARALGQFTFRTQTHSDVCKERYVALLQVLQGLRANMCQAPGSYSSGLHLMPPLMARIEKQLTRGIWAAVDRPSPTN